MALFSDEAAFFIGWIHYIAFDGLVARWMVLDSVEKEASVLIHVCMVIPCLFVNVMLGPMGFLMYFIARNFIPDVKSKQKSL